MRVIVRPFPVIYACPGCTEFGQRARDVGTRLNRAGVAELIWLGDGRDGRPTQRYPIFALDGCTKACALRWLHGHGIVPQRSHVLRAG